MSDQGFIDPIVEEVRRMRDAHAAKFKYDLDAIVQDLREQQKKSGRSFVTLPPRRISDLGDNPGQGAA